MLIRLAKADRQVALDYREKAPAAAHRDMFLTKDGAPDPKLSRYSRLASGVPGTVRGLAHALRRYGTISLQRALAPAIKLAGEGFVVGPDLHRSLKSCADDLRADKEARSIFLDTNGRVWPVGSILVQRDLARSLRLLSDKGPDAFYLGDIATAIDRDMRAHGGLITRKDLADYQPVERAPIKGNYRGWKILSMPPPSSGGIHLVQMLNILENFPIADYGAHSAQTVHLMTEAMKRAYADRSRYLGDPDFSEIPIARLVSRDYGQHLARGINPHARHPAAWSPRVSDLFRPPRAGRPLTSASLTGREMRYRILTPSTSVTAPESLSRVLGSFSTTKWTTFRQSRDRQTPSV